MVMINAKLSAQAQTKLCPPKPEARSGCSGSPLARDAFAGFHPLVNLLYFVTVIGFAMFFMHPVCLAISFVCAVAYSVYLGGKKTVRVGLRFMLPMLVFTALLNPLFNHQGVTILAYLPNGNPLTLESILYGIAAAVMLITVIAWFSCWNAVMTSDKFIYLFGRIIPALSLILSMALRLVPRFRAQVKVISNAQKCIGRNVSSGNLLQKVRHGARILSIMVTWALENAIETADSMKGRGYGLPGRTVFSIFRTQRRDVYAMAYILVCAAFIIAGAATGAYHFRYFPSVRGQWAGGTTVAVFAAYFALAALPLIVNLKEDLTWKRIESKT
ncbi:MAG: energy-coupling factor transporter transmembrane protein EcfT [Oscillospiraceae bacterium]|nr:energy-coupling factor transporter transmembrane protein EcfT [Oscillospiraceae bacterium]